ncbi:MAG: glucosaminidase domain-containing protein [Colwellia sp.]|nr:glucosaminidase domain-containing protein [Colwellia sp.]
MGKHKILNLSSLLKSLLLTLFVFSLIAPFQQSKRENNSSQLVEKSEATKKKLVVKIPEVPLHKVILPDFAKIRDVKEKKRQFFNYIKPAIERENNKLLTLREKVITLKDQLLLEQTINIDDKALLKQLNKKYKVRNNYGQLSQIDQLLARIDVVPSSLILVQAANESAWGTSRFARIGLNFFGIWCYKKGCGMVPNGRNDDATHEVQSFKSVDDAVQRYLHNINTNNAYIVFRTIRSQLREQDQPLSPEILATGLLPYSERGAEYVLEITKMIRHNQVYFDAPSE